MKTKREKKQRKMKVKMIKIAMFRFHPFFFFLSSPWEQDAVVFIFYFFLPSLFFYFLLYPIFFYFCVLLGRLVLGPLSPLSPLYTMVHNFIFCGER